MDHQRAARGRGVEHEESTVVDEAGAPSIDVHDLRRHVVDHPAEELRGEGIDVTAEARGGAVGGEELEGRLVDAAHRRVHARDLRQLVGSQEVGVVGAHRRERLGRHEAVDELLVAGERPAVAPIAHEWCGLSSDAEPSEAITDGRPGRLGVDLHLADRIELAAPVIDASERQEDERIPSQQLLAAGKAGDDLVQRRRITVGGVSDPLALGDPVGQEGDDRRAKLACTRVGPAEMIVASEPRGVGDGARGAH